MRWWIAAGVMILGVAGVAAAQEWKAPASAKHVKNPVAGTEGIRTGKALFDTNCVMCHGASGKGDGPVGAALNPKPRNLTDTAVQAETDGELFWKISEGRGAMPPWKQLPEKDRWSLVLFMRSLAGRK